MDSAVSDQIVALPPAALSAPATALTPLLRKLAHAAYRVPLTPGVRFATVTGAVLVCSDAHWALLKALRCHTVAGAMTEHLLATIADKPLADVYEVLRTAAQEYAGDLPARDKALKALPSDGEHVVRPHRSGYVLLCVVAAMRWGEPVRVPTPDDPRIESAYTMLVQQFKTSHGYIPIAKPYVANKGAALVNVLALLPSPDDILVCPTGDLAVADTWCTLTNLTYTLPREIRHGALDLGDGSGVIQRVLQWATHADLGACAALRERIGSTRHAPPQAPASYDLMCRVVARLVLVGVLDAIIDNTARDCGSMWRTVVEEASPYMQNRGCVASLIPRAAQKRNASSQGSEAMASDDDGDDDGAGPAIGGDDESSASSASSSAVSASAKRVRFAPAAQHDATQAPNLAQTAAEAIVALRRSCDANAQRVVELKAAESAALAALAQARRQLHEFDVHMEQAIDDGLAGPVPVLLDALLASAREPFCAVTVACGIAGENNTDAHAAQLLASSSVPGMHAHARGVLAELLTRDTPKDRAARIIAGIDDATAAEHADLAETALLLAMQLAPAVDAGACPGVPDDLRRVVVALRAACPQSSDAGTDSDSDNDNDNDNDSDTGASESDA